MYVLAHDSTLAILFLQKLIYFLCERCARFHDEEMETANTTTTAAAATVKNWYERKSNTLHSYTRNVWIRFLCVVTGHDYIRRTHTHTHVASRYYLKKELSDQFLLSAQCVRSHVYHFIFYWYRDLLYLYLCAHIIRSLFASCERAPSARPYYTRTMANDLNFIHRYFTFSINQIKSIKYVEWSSHVAVQSVCVILSAVAFP